MYPYTLLRHLYLLRLMVYRYTHSHTRRVLHFPASPSKSLSLYICLLLRLTFDMNETLRDAQVELKGAPGLYKALASGYYADTCWHGLTPVIFHAQLESFHP